MKVSEIKKLIKKYSKNIIKKYALQDWDIEIIVYKTAKENDQDKNTIATIDHAFAEYQSARIEFYAENVKDEHCFLRTLKHELYHIILSPFDMIFEEVNELIKNEQIKTLLHNYRLKCEELAICNLEKVKY